MLGPHTGIYIFNTPITKFHGGTRQFFVLVKKMSLPGHMTGGATVNDPIAPLPCLSHFSPYRRRTPHPTPQIPSWPCVVGYAVIDDDSADEEEDCAFVLVTDNYHVVGLQDNL